MKGGKMILIVLMILLFLAGLVIFLYPYINKAVVDTTLRNDAQEFIDRVTVELWEEETLPGEQETVPTEPSAPVGAIAYLDSVDTITILVMLPGAVMVTELPTYSL